MWILGIQLKQKVEAEDDQEKFRLLKNYYESGKLKRSMDFHNILDGDLNSKRKGYLGIS